MTKECINREIEIAVRNINAYISSLSGEVDESIINKIKETREQIKLNNWNNLFNLIYVDKNGDIIKICNEKKILEYTKEEDGLYRTRIDIDDDEYHVYPKKKIKVSGVQEDLNIMEYREQIYA